MAAAATDAPALLLGLDEGPSLVIPMLTGRTHPRARSTAEALAWMAGQPKAGPVWIAASSAAADALAADPRLVLLSRAPFEAKQTDLVLLSVRPVP
ncbi:MAG: hypothetical protein M0C28_18235 [Candidatus Moduliflexus flocculans]|nr:hypothetical protein [Candidatus Moduliflexus flocculans]